MRVGHRARGPRPRSATVYSDDDSAHTADHAFVTEQDTFTGILDQDGRPIFRQPEPIGFDPYRWAERPKPPAMRISHGGRSMGGKEHSEGQPCKICDKAKGKR